MDTPDSLARDMLKAAGEAIVGTRAIVQKGSLNIKNGARANVQQSAPIHNAHAQYAITYDTDIDLAGAKVSGEIGYDRAKRGGKLGNLLEYGNGSTSAPHRDLSRALDAETPNFEAALGLMAGKLL